MKLFLSLAVLAFCVYVQGSDCDCCEKRVPVKACDEPTPKIKVIHYGTPCECQKALPFRVEVPVVPKEKLYKHKYNIYSPKKPCSEERFIYDTKIEKPVCQKQKTYTYPIQVQKLPKVCDPVKYIYDARVEKPKDTYQTRLEGLTAKLDTIVIPAKDCPMPCCQCKVEPKSCEVCKKCGVSSEECGCKKCEVSSEECGCKKCEVSSEECGCKKCEVSSEECGCKKCEVSSEECGCKKCEVSSEECSYECPKPKECRKCEQSCLESSEEVIRCPKVKGCRRCEEISEETGCGCYVSSCEDSSEECYRKRRCGCSDSYSSESCDSSDESRCGCASSCEDSSEEIVYPCHKKRTCGCSSEEIYVSSDSCGCYDSSEEISCGCKRPRKTCPKVKGCRRCEEISEETGCGCYVSSYEDSSEECYRKKSCGCSDSYSSESCDSSDESRCGCASSCEDSSEEIVYPCQKKKTCGCSSEEICYDSSSSEEISCGCKRPRKTCPKVKGCKRCEEISEEYGCGCSVSSQSSESCDSSDELSYGCFASCGCQEPKKRCPKIKGCKKCEASSEEYGCGCSVSRKSESCSSEEFSCGSFSSSCEDTCCEKKKPCGCAEPELVYVKTRKSYRPRTCGCN